jgi:ABC-type antimicrobial peptide transport system permease subunit
MALGAQRSHIVWIVAKATLATVASGIVVGLLLHLSLEQALRHWTPASAPTPWVLLSVTLLLLVCATISCLLPTRRAANLDPMQTLRSD